VTSRQVLEERLEAAVKHLQQQTIPADAVRLWTLTLSNLVATIVGGLLVTADVSHRSSP